MDRERPSVAHVDARLREHRVARRRAHGLAEPLRHDQRRGRGDGWVSAMSGTETIVIAYPAIANAQCLPVRSEARPVPSRSTSATASPAPDTTPTTVALAPSVARYGPGDAAPALVHEVAEQADDAERDTKRYGESRFRPGRVCLPPPAAGITGGRACPSPARCRRLHARDAEHTLPHPQRAVVVQGHDECTCGVDGLMTMNGRGVETVSVSAPVSNQMKTAVCPRCTARG